MRFTLIKDIRQDNSMKPILNGLLIFTLIYLLADIFVTYSSLGLFEEAIKTTLFGDEEEFLDPMSKSIFLEYIHAQIFFMMMLLLTLSAVYARVSNKKTHSILLINIVMISGLLTLISLGVSYFIKAQLIQLYIASFFTWHTTAFYMSSYSLWALNFEKSI